MAVVKISAPLTDELLATLRCGDEILINGTVYVARDAAHKRLVDLLDAGQPLPFEVQGQIIYYMGPSPAKPGEVIGAAGPTTSYRMDAYAPRLIELGLKAMIGKGARSPEVKAAMVKHKAIYMAAIGGTGALLSKQIKSNEIIAYEELGAEAIRRIEVENFPVILINDIYGGDLYTAGKQEFANRNQEY
jgi:fumarate hydratase subunit beta